MEAPVLPPDSAFRFRVTLATRWSDEDNHSVLNNAVYMSLCEEARLAYFRRLGLLEDNQFPFLLGQTNIRFVRPGRGGRPVVVEAATTRIGNKSFDQAYRIRDEASGEVLAEAVATLVGFDGVAGRSVALSDSFRAAIASMEEADAARR